MTISVRTRPCTTCGQLSLEAKLLRRTAAMDELWHIEARHTVALIQWLIRLAEATFDRFGGYDNEHFELNRPLAAAIEEAGRDVAQRCQEPDAFYADVHVEETVNQIANAIAVRLGEKPRSGWTSGGLGGLAGRAKS